jgi:hypothetical protein
MRPRRSPGRYINVDTSRGDRLVIAPESKQLRRAYPLYGGLQNFPESAPAPTR